MKKLIERFVEYPMYANIIIIIVVLVGAFSYTQMNKSFFLPIQVMLGQQFMTILLIYVGLNVYTSLLLSFMVGVHVFVFFHIKYVRDSGKEERP